MTTKTAKRPKTVVAAAPKSIAEIDKLLAATYAMLRPNDPEANAKVWATLDQLLDDRLVLMENR